MGTPPPPDYGLGGLDNSALHDSPLGRVGTREPAPGELWGGVPGRQRVTQSGRAADLDAAGAQRPGPARQTEVPAGEGQWVRDGHDEVVAEAGVEVADLAPRLPRAASTIGCDGRSARTRTGPPAGGGQPGRGAASGDTRGTARGRDRSVRDGPRPSSRPRRRWPRVPGRRSARRGSARSTIRARRVWAGSRRGRSGRARAAAWSATTATTRGTPGGRSARFVFVLRRL